MFDRYKGVPIFLVAAAVLLPLGLWFARELKARRADERDLGLRLAARDAFDLGAHDALDQARQIVVEPGLEHRAQHFLHQILKRARVLPEHGVRQAY